MENWIPNDISEKGRDDEAPEAILNIYAILNTIARDSNSFNKRNVSHANVGLRLTAGKSYTATEIRRALSLRNTTWTSRDSSSDRVTGNRRSWRVQKLQFLFLYSHSRRILPYSWRQLKALVWLFVTRTGIESDFLSLKAIAWTSTGRLC